MLPRHDVRDLLAVMIHVPAEELEPLARIKRAGEEVRRDHHFEVEGSERLPERNHHRRAGGERRDPVGQRPEEIPNRSRPDYSVHRFRGIGDYRTDSNKSKVSVLLACRTRTTPAR
jgi:hypothetical protein